MTPSLRRLLDAPDVAAILAAFRHAGVEARLVGGAVRDAVMGRTPGDTDIATPMPPEDVMRLAGRQGWKAVPTGIAHGTVTLVLSGRPYEVTTLRRDVETDGRRAVVAFTDDFREDAFRRDFTINALSLTADGVVHDYATGLADAAAGVVRFMGDAETRIREDYLRILRFFRFQASHGHGAPEPAGLAACARLKTGMAQLSRERVRQELVKLIPAAGAPAAVDAMAAAGIWSDALPGIAIDAPAFRRWAALGGAIQGAGDPMSGLAALTDAPPKLLAAGLKLSRAEESLLETIRGTADVTARAAKEPELLREAIYRAGSAAFLPALRAAAARAALPEAVVRDAVAAAQPLLASPPRLPFRSADAGALGVPAGPRMGRVLKAAEAAWIAAGLPEDEAAAARLMEEAVRSTPD